MYMSTQNGCSLAISLIETESQNASASFKQNMAAMASDGPSPHSPSLRLGLPAPQTSIGDHFDLSFGFPINNIISLATTPSPAGPLIS